VFRADIRFNCCVCVEMVVFERLLRPISYGKTQETGTQRDSNSPTGAVALEDMKTMCLGQIFGFIAAFVFKCLNLNVFFGPENGQ